MTLEELMVEIGINTDDLTGGAQGAADEVESSLGGIQAAAAGAAIGGLFAMGLANAMDASAANTKLANQLGLTEAEAERAGGVAGEVFSAGFGDSIGTVSDALGAVTQNIGGLGKATDAELDQMTRSALALADTFEFDVGESTQAVGTLIKTGMAKDGLEAFDLLTAAAQKLPPKLREEIPAMISEYGEFFDQLGFTGPDMMGVLAQAAQDPTFQIDKLGDAVKEFTLLMADTAKVEKPLQELGLNVKDLQKLMNEGKGTQAFDQVTKALKDVEDQTKRTELQAALFGGPGEDMGNSLLNLNAAGAAAATGLDDTAGAAKNVTDSMAASQAVDSIMRTMATTIGELLAPALTIVAGLMKEHPGLIKVLVPILLGLALAIGIAVVAQWAWNTALWAFPGTWIIAAIIALIAIIVLIVVYWDEIAAATERAWDWMATKIGEGLDWIGGKITDVLDWITGKWDDGWAWISDKTSAGIDTVMRYIGNLSRVPGQVAGWLGDLVGYVAGLPGRIARAASGMWDSLKYGFINVVNYLIWKWNNFQLTLGGGSIMGVDIPSVTLSTPDIPYLAEGGVTTGPTVAMIGEGSEQEAVLPLSKLDGMLRSVAGSVRSTGGQPRDQRLVLELVGADSEFTEFFRNVVRTKGGGDVVQFAEG
ncbi:phage tail tape measure protein [Streptomyces sp. NPDC058620]|uniref:phage tail tape measure protein n=1 Tax=Streptomyces sp. NPDC058620 TaxID=3346560 RepID=UPI00364E09F2